jgi:hypothetical protein
MCGHEEDSESETSVNSDPIVENLYPDGVMTRRSHAVERILADIPAHMRSLIEAGVDTQVIVDALVEAGRMEEHEDGFWYTVVAPHEHKWGYDAGVSIEEGSRRVVKCFLFGCGKTAPARIRFEVEE